MDNFKKKCLKIIVIGAITVFMGIFIGHQLSVLDLYKVQSFLLNAAGEAVDLATDPNATDANATDANATDANATAANATDANATDPNASDPNADSSYNEIYLDNFTLKERFAKVGDKVYLEILTHGACNSGATISFKHAKYDTVFTAKVEDINNNPYIVVPSSVIDGQYVVTDLLLVGTNSDDSTFTYNFTAKWNDSGECSPYGCIVAEDYNVYNIVELTVEGEDVKLNSISLENKTAKMTDKVYVKVNASDVLSKLKLEFENSNHETMVVYVKSLESKPYFEIPSGTELGTYNLTSAALTTLNGTTVYRSKASNGEETFNFNSALEITKTFYDEKDYYLYNNEDITSAIISSLLKASDNVKIIINADSNTIINTELFNAIKGKNKDLVLNYSDNQVVFNGKGVNNAKTIDVAMSVKEIAKDSELGSLVNNGVVVNFADNGNLPGKAKVRIKASSLTNRLLNNNVYVYYYNDLDNTFSLIDSNVNKTSDGYYEFDITHNSDYILVNERLDENLLSTEQDSNVVSFQKSDNMHLILIAAAVIVIITVSAMIIVAKSSRSKNQ